jgi:RNA polymerase sigma factor (sigma-70 family)
MAGGSTERLQRDLTTLFQAGSAAGLTDGELVSRISRATTDEAEALFEVLVDRHGPMVLRVCRNALGDPHDADDAFQATFLVLAQRLRSIRKLDSLASWLYGVAARVSARARVDAARRCKCEGESGRLAVVAPPSDSDADGLAVQEEVLRLPDRYRSVVVLCYWEGLTHEQAAARLDCPVGTVRSRVARARELLRRRLVRKGVGSGIEIETAPAIRSVPAGLIQTTVRTAAKVASGRAVCQVAESYVAGLTLQIVRRMFMTKVGMIAAPACLLLATTLALALGAQTAKQADREGKTLADNGPSTSRRTQPGPELKEYIIEPSDVLLVEILEALPGRPLSGERVVRSDGKISLGFYGDVYVAGLTIREAKEKIVVHMQKYMNDETLGLIDEIDDKRVDVPAGDSDRVFVDVTATNSKVYYVQGEVLSPGRFPITGKETILDAVNLAGGLTSKADHDAVLLIRNDPKGGTQQTFRIDIDEVLLGEDASSNYYLLAGDRLVVRRDPGAQEDAVDRPAEAIAAAPLRPKAAAVRELTSSSNASAKPTRRDARPPSVERRLETIEALLRRLLKKSDQP